MIWDVARSLLNQAVPAHLGEEVELARPDEVAASTFPIFFGGPIGEATIVAVLTRPEQLVRLGLSTVTMGDARMTARVADAPDWFARGVIVTTVAGETFEVTAIVDNGEGLLEVTLCRSS